MIIMECACVHCHVHMVAPAVTMSKWHLWKRSSRKKIKLNTFNDYNSMQDILFVLSLTCISADY